MNEPVSLPTIKTLDYIVIPCRNLRVMRTFYQEVLGLTIAYERHDWITFQLGGVTLALRPRSTPFFGTAREVERPSIQLAFCVESDHVDQWYEALRALDIPILESPKDQTWGHRTLYFSDPEENVLEIYTDCCPASTVSGCRA